MDYRDFDLKIIRLAPGHYRAEVRAPDGLTGQELSLGRRRAGFDQVELQWQRWRYG